MAKSKGVNRLSIVVGLLFCSIPWCMMALLVIIKGPPTGLPLWIILRDVGVFSLFMAIIGWIIIRVLYWVYCGFEEDRLSKKQGIDNGTDF